MNDDNIFSFKLVEASRFIFENKNHDYTRENTIASINNGMVSEYNQSNEKDRTIAFLDDAILFMEDYIMDYYWNESSELSTMTFEEIEKEIKTNSIEIKIEDLKFT